MSDTSKCSKMWWSCLAITTLSFFPFVSFLLQNDGDKSGRLATAGVFLKSSPSMFTVQCCLISSCMSMLLDLLLDAYSFNQESIQAGANSNTPEIKMSLLAERGLIVGGLIVPAVGVIICIQKCSDALLASFFLNITNVEIFIFVGVTFLIAEKLSIEKNFYMKHNYLMMTEMVVACVVQFMRASSDYEILFWDVMLYVVTFVIMLHYTWLVRRSSEEYQTAVRTGDSWTVKEQFIRHMYFSFGFIYMTGTFALIAYSCTFRGFSYYGPLRVTFICVKIIMVSFLSLLTGRAARSQILTMQNMLQARKDFIRYLCHEVRSPLNVVGVGILLVEDILRERGVAITSNLDDAVESIKNSCVGAVETLDDVLNFDKLSSSLMLVYREAFSVESLINGCVKMFQVEMRNMRIIFKYPCPEDYVQLFSGVPSMIHVDFPKMMVCFRNLVGNAMKFTPADGTISLELSILDSYDAISLEVLPMNEERRRRETLLERIRNSCCNSKRIDQDCQQKYIRIDVRDTGKGVSPECLPCLFKQGFQESPNKMQEGKGSGFGLAITKGIVELHSGYIAASSDGVFKGSTFSIALPLFSSEDMIPPDHERPSTPSMSMNSQQNLKSDWSLKGKRILIVDDMAPCRKIVSMLFESRGALVDTAKNGSQAKDMVEYSMRRIEEAYDEVDCAPMYDFIVIDNLMPVMGGIEACREIRKLSYRKTIIGLTGSAVEEEVSDFIAAGASSVLTKPLDIEELYRTMKLLDLSE